MFFNAGDSRIHFSRGHVMPISEPSSRVPSLLHSPLYLLQCQVPLFSHGWHLRESIYPVPDGLTPWSIEDDSMGALFPLCDQLPCIQPCTGPMASPGSMRSMALAFHMFLPMKIQNLNLKPPRNSQRLPWKAMDRTNPVRIRDGQTRP